MAAVALGGVQLSAQAEPQPAVNHTPPNIVLILADDLGYGDLSIQGCKQFATPHMDSIAQSGIRFSNAYVSSPVCAPSRAGLLSGRYQDRFGFLGNPAPGAKWGLPVNQPTLASALKTAGYRTAAFGKWHLGEPKQYRPLQRGFDEFYGFLSGKHSYWKADDPEWGPVVSGDAVPAKLPKYMTFALADKACEFIRTSGSDPFFLYLAFNAPHAPLEAPPDYLKKTAWIKDRRRATYAAMVLALDDAVGQVLQCIRQSGRADHTLIVFLSDNGGPTIPGSDMNGSSNAPLRGSKAQLWEGGIRVPFFVCWPGKIPSGIVSDQPVVSLDLFPTFTALAGVKAPSGIDGTDLSALWFGMTDPLPPRAFFWRFYDTQLAVRTGDLKWVRVDARRGLYNVNEDPGESNDLLNRSDTERIRSLWQEWDRLNLREILP
jgi:arylsulfatase A-like enzyme